VDKVVLFSHVDKYIMGVRVLKDVSLTVYSRDRVLVYGPKNAGKTILARLASCILNRDGGYIEIFGLDPIIYRREILSRLGYIPQYPHTPPNLSIYDSICFRCRLLDVNVEDVIKRIVEYGYGKYLHARAEEVDRGVLKNILAVSILSMKPDLIVIDDIDGLNKGIIEGLVSEVIDDGATILATSRRRYGEIDFNRVYYIEGGALREG